MNKQVTKGSEMFGKNKKEWIPVSTAEMCQQSHGGPTCTTDAEFARRHTAYRAGLTKGLRQRKG